MENFIVSARKYRPATFDTVVGQLSITSTLKNAIKNNHLAHAYLFTGPRGVGKTTCARIFAKTINCFNLSSEMEACDKCESCLSFNDSRSYNIHELDAASNNSVDDIRVLIDQVRIPPQVGKYSIYIIDEVHMLSTAAFNAFLKTLEEPPKHAIFILATTEKHKIIPTILSRCQIFDFRRIKIEDIVLHLVHVAKGENIEAEHDALNIIAQKADGALRDALSFFDQVVSFSGEKITYKNVIENLNVLDYDYYFRLTDAYLTSDYTSALMIFNEILEKGFDAHHFITGLSSHFRDLLVCTDAITLQLIEVGDSLREKYKVQAQRCSPAFLLKALTISNTCDIYYKGSRNPRLHVELAMLQMCNILKDIEAEKKSNVVTANPQKTSAVQNTAATAAEAPAEPPKPKADVASMNIKDILNVPVEKKNDVTVVVEKPEPVAKLSNPFNQSQLENAWRKFTKSIETSTPRMFSLLSSQVPQLKSATTIEFPVSTQLQDDYLGEVRPDLVQFLRKELQNTAIELKTLIVQQVEVKKKAMTTPEKFEYLNEINPELSKLKEKFNLDFA